MILVSNVMLIKTKTAKSRSAKELSSKCPKRLNQEYFPCFKDPVPVSSIFKKNFTIHVLMSK